MILASAFLQGEPVTCNYHFLARFPIWPKGSDGLLCESSKLLSGQLLGLLQHPSDPGLRLLLLSLLITEVRRVLQLTARTESLNLLLNIQLVSQELFMADA